MFERIRGMRSKIANRKSKIRVPLPVLTARVLKFRFTSEAFMKIALNGATTMHADLETDIRAAGAAGFDLV